MRPLRQYDGANMNAMKRATRLNQIKDLLRGRRAGYTVEELARMTGMHKRSIQRDLNDIEADEGVPLVVAKNRYSIMQPERLPSLSLSLHEARAMLIATRLFLRYSDEADAFAASALEKIARIMPHTVKPQVEAAARAVSERPLDADFTRNLSTVTDAWARQRALRLSYRSAGKQRPKEVIVLPYFLEPSAAGFSTYLIGYSKTHEQIRTFKVERIVSADMLPEHFELPDDLDVDSLLASAWGIIWGEGVEVKLRFRPDIVWRVKESRWHPTQDIEDLADGSCVLTLRVASTMEVGRWVRGWGDAVEVLAPAALRDELRQEAVRIARIYSAPAKPLRKVGTARKRTARTAGDGALPLPEAR